jgi:hypothetical protein
MGFYSILGDFGGFWGIFEDCFIKNIEGNFFWKIGRVFFQDENLLWKDKREGYLNMTLFYVKMTVIIF